MTKPLDTKTALKMLILRHPDWTTDDLLAELAALGFELPTRFLVSETRSRFKDDLRFLKQAGVIDDARLTVPLHPELKRRPRKWKLGKKHYAAGSRDD